MMDFNFWGFCSNKKHKFYVYFTLKNHFKPNTLFWNRHKWSDLKCCCEQELDSGHWSYIIIKVRVFMGLFMFWFSVLPLVVMCLLLVLFVLKLKYWANFGWDFFLGVGYPFPSKLKVFFFVCGLKPTKSYLSFISISLSLWLKKLWGTRWRTQVNFGFFLKVVNLAWEK